MAKLSVPKLYKTANGLSSTCALLEEAVQGIMGQKIQKSMLAFYTVKCEWMQ